MDPTRILLLEDDLRLREALAEVLDLEGYKVVAAADGAEAVEKAADFPFELLIFDVKLPGPDGLEILSRFRQSNPDLPSIVITGYASEADALRALRLGVGEYLEKPFNSSVLITAVRRLERVVHQQRRSHEQDESLLQVVLWALNFLNRSAGSPEHSFPVPPEEAGRVAYRAAYEAGFGRSAARELQGAVLLSIALQRQAAREELEELSLHIPESVQHLCDSLHNEQEQEGLIKIGSVCSRLAFDESLWPEVRSMLGETSGLLPAHAQDKQRRHLLSLGRGLMATGDLIGARAAFQRVLESAPPREQGFALLELGRLAWKGGENKEAVDYLRKVMSIVSNLGPKAATELELEAAQVSLTMGLDQGNALLERGRKRLERLGVKGLLAQVELALGLLNSQSLDTLEPTIQNCLPQPRLGFLVGGANWLLPLMSKAAGQEDESLKMLASRVAQAAPQVVGRLLDATQDGDELLSLLELLEAGGLRQVNESLQRLSQRQLGAASKLATSLLEDEQTVKRQVRVFSLGRVEVWLGDTPIPSESWRTSRSRHILARLLQSSRRSVNQDTLMEEFWPGLTADRARKNLSQALSDLRRAFRMAKFDQADDLIVRKQESVWIQESVNVWHDLDWFHTHMEKGDQCLKRGEVRESISCYQEALLLVRGGFMEDCNLEWSEVPRREFERVFVQCQEKLADCCREVELYPEVEEVANRILERDPCHQVAHRLLMEAHIHQGKPEQAIRHFERARVALLNEMGIEPHTDLLRAYQLAKLAL
jgi:DNA-binding response OmpR family regulator